MATEDNLEVCPLCNSKLIMGKDSKASISFYKCTNPFCHFKLRENYLEYEIYLQGKQLKSKCVYCGRNLVVAGSNYGLYARCFNCKGDVVPSEYGKSRKFANAYNYEAQQEIEAMKTRFLATREQEVQREVEDNDRRIKELTRDDFEDEFEEEIEGEIDNLEVINNDIKSSIISVKSGWIKPYRELLSDYIPVNLKLRQRNSFLLHIFYSLRLINKNIYMTTNNIYNIFGTDSHLHYIFEGCSKPVIKNDIYKLCSWGLLSHKKSKSNEYLYYLSTETFNRINAKKGNVEESIEISYPQYIQDFLNTAKDRYSMSDKTFYCIKRVIEILNSNLKEPYSSKQLAEKISNSNVCSSEDINLVSLVCNSILIKEKIIELVDITKGRDRGYLFQLKHSPLKRAPKVETTDENWDTIGQISNSFYKYSINQKRTDFLRDKLENSEDIDHVLKNTKGGGYHRAYNKRDILNIIKKYESKYEFLRGYTDIVDQKTNTAKEAVVDNESKVEIQPVDSLIDSSKTYKKFKFLSDFLSFFTKKKKVPTLNPDELVQF